MDTVTLVARKGGGKIDVQLVSPASFAECLDVQLAADKNPQRAAMAALGLCLPHVRRRIPFLGDALAFGGQVLDYLGTEGHTLSSMLRAARVAMRLCQEKVAELNAAVEEAVGNFEAPAGGTTERSPASSDGTASPPAGSRPSPSRRKRGS